MNAKTKPIQTASNEAATENQGRTDELTEVTGAELKNVDGGRAAVNLNQGLNRVSIPGRSYTTADTYF